MPRNQYWTSANAASAKASIDLFHKDLTYRPNSDSAIYDNIAVLQSSMNYSDYVRVYLRADSAYSVSATGTYTTSVTIFDADGYLYDTTITPQYDQRVDKSGYYYILIDWRYLSTAAPGGYTLSVSEDVGADGVNTTVTSASIISTAFSNIMRTSGSATATAIAGQLQAGTLTKASAIAKVVDLADATTSVATLSYQFFTGKMPTAGGIDYLVSPTGGNANNLNSAYYQSFSLENRYINFAVNLGAGGEGKAAFQAAYGNLSLLDATKKAYSTIFGSTPTDAKAHALIDGRVSYFAYYGQDGGAGLGTKAAMVGWLLAEAVKADVGSYAKAEAAFLTDLADGANFGVDLIGTYGRADYAYLGG